MTQAVSFPLEALFLLGVLISLITLFAALVLLLRKRPVRARRLLAILSIAWAGYLSIVFLVAAATPRLVIPMNQDLCFDEMCFAVANLQTAGQIGSARANGVFYIVSVRASNHGRGRAQSEGGLRALLWSAGQEYEVSQPGQNAWEVAGHSLVPLTTRLNPGQSVVSDQVFDMPRQGADPGLVLTHGFTPGYFVIGECPLFHKPTILRISQ
jgi:hypothetical protein